MIPITVTDGSMYLFCRNSSHKKNTFALFQSERTRRKKYIDFESEKIIYVDRDPEERRFVRHSPIHSDVDYVLVEEIPREIVRRRRAPQKVIYVEEDEDEEDDLVYVDQHGNEVELFHKRSPILYRRIR